MSSVTQNRKGSNNRRARATGERTANGKAIFRLPPGAAITEITEDGAPVFRGQLNSSGNRVVIFCPSCAGIGGISAIHVHAVDPEDGNRPTWREAKCPSVRSCDYRERSYYQRGYYVAAEKSATPANRSPVNLN